VCLAGNFPSMLFDVTPYVVGNSNSGSGGRILAASASSVT
jgi:hypothetical protein